MKLFFEDLRVSFSLIQAPWMVWIKFSFRQHKKTRFSLRSAQRRNGVETEGLDMCMNIWRSAVEETWKANFRPKFRKLGYLRTGVKRHDIVYLCSTMGHYFIPNGLLETELR